MTSAPGTALSPPGTPINDETLVTQTSYVDRDVSAGSTHRYVVTAVDLAGQESPPSAEVSATVAAGGTPLIASDSFGRTLVDRWGSASTGGAYTLQGSAADYDVDGSLGTMALRAGADRSALLTGVTALEVDATVALRTDKAALGGSQFGSLVSRRVDTAHEYRSKVRLAPDGGVWIRSSVVVDGVESPLGAEVRVAGLQHTPGRLIRLRTHVTGSDPTTIRIRAWADGTSEPGGWQYSTTNAAPALQRAGALGLRAYLASSTTNGPVVFGFDDFEARVVAAGGTP